MIRGESSLDLDRRMLLFRIDHSHQPSHDEIDEADASREVLSIKKLHFVRKLFTFVKLSFLLLDDGRRR